MNNRLYLYYYISMLDTSINEIYVYIASNHYKLIIYIIKVDL